MMIVNVRIEAKQVSKDIVYHEIEACTEPRYYDVGSDKQLQDQHILLDNFSSML